MSTATTTTDPIDLLSRLTDDGLRARLIALDAERKAIIVLLNAIRARDRRLRRAREADSRRAKAGEGVRP